jgi:hypothetical protein
MRQHFSAMAAVAAAVVCSALLAGPSAAGAGTQRAVMAHSAAAGGTWGKAEEVPGLAALGDTRGSEVHSLSCGSAGNCSAGGGYFDASSNQQGFVVNEANGIWRKAENVPGLAALNTGGAAYVASVSCASAGNCSAAGDYSMGQWFPAFAVGETKGIWGKAEKLLPGLGFASINSLSCAAPGDCTAGGFSGNSHPFVVSETSGTWGQEERLPGMRALNTGGFGEVVSVSCGAPGNCGAGGYYSDRSTKQYVFAASQRNGNWGKAFEVPGTNLDDGGAQISSVSCASAGNCSAGGYSSNGQAFVANETNGTWAKALPVPGLAALNTGGNAAVDSVSCASAGNCSAGGYYSYISKPTGVVLQHGFVVSEVHGTWGKAMEIPGLAALDIGAGAYVASVSCGSAGNCSAGGGYSDASSHQQGFVVNQTNGIWGKAIEVPGLAALNVGPGAYVVAVSCGAAGRCSAVGEYTDASLNLQTFVVNEN